MTRSELLDKVADGLAHGEYSLLLGAGGTVGTVGGNGRSLPTGAGLRDALLTDFKVETGGETVSLAQAYHYVWRFDAASLALYLRGWFTNCQSSWQHLFAEFSWHRIWTFNIDDVLEGAFRKESRPFRSHTWYERFSDRQSPQGHQIIHLHGSADRLAEGESNDEVLVFSILEYARAVSAPRTWHKVFIDEFAQYPFLVIGARLAEEFDLAEVLHTGTTAATTTGYPSVVVLRSVTPFQRNQLEAAGLVVVECDAETFVNDLLERYRTALCKLDEVYGKITPEVRRFLQQFIDLRSFNPIQSESQDFYSGYQPTWNTIQRDDDAILDVTARASEQIIS